MTPYLIQQLQTMYKISQVKKDNLTKNKIKKVMQLTHK